MERGTEPESPIGARAVASVIGHKFDAVSALDIDGEGIALTVPNDRRAKGFAAIDFDYEDAASVAILGQPAGACEFGPTFVQLVSVEGRSMSVDAVGMELPSRGEKQVRMGKVVVGRLTPTYFLLVRGEVTERNPFSAWRNVLGFSELFASGSSHKSLSKVVDLVELRTRSKLGVELVKGGLQAGVVASVESLDEGREREVSLQGRDLWLPLLIDGIRVGALASGPVDMAGEDAEFSSFARDQVPAIKGEAAVGIRHGGDSVGIIVTLALRIEIGDEAVDRQVGGHLSREEERPFPGCDGEVLELSVSVDLNFLLRTRKKRMRSEPEGARKLEVRTGAFSAQLVSVPSVTVTHERAMILLPQRGGLPIVGQRESVTKFVRNAADEKGVVLAKGNLAILLVGDERLLGGEVGNRELGRIKLPSIPATVGASGIVGRFVRKMVLRGIPGGEVAEDEESLVVGIEPRLLQSGQALLANSSSGLSIVICEWFLPAHEMNLEKSLFVLGQRKGELAEAVAFHFLAIEGLDVFHNSGQPLVVICSWLTIGGSPIDDLQSAIGGGRVFHLPSGQRLQRCTSLQNRGVCGRS